MEETKQEKGMNKNIFILGGIILLAVIAMFVLKPSGVDEIPVTEDPGGGGVEVIDTDSSTDIAQEPEVKTEPETTKTIPLLGKTLSPGETVQAFYTALGEKRYKDTLGYISPQSEIETKQDLIEITGARYRDYSRTEIEISSTEYLDKSKTTVKVRFATYNLYEGGKQSGEIDLRKENGVWKIIG